ncbi:gliding motility-associated C-terminal domain-containing protein [Polaribacter sp.]|uniref:gliding motility-associated C-terminal domain-containing protein n=1 Tax=Polaribacter sp. TaxID=1920175 RepID=UPI003EFA035F
MYLRKLLLTCVVVLGYVQVNFAQCVNPQPTTTFSTQTFCASENKTVSNLVAVGGNIVWYNAETGGLAYDPTAKLKTGAYYADDEIGGGCSTSRLKVNVFVYGAPPNTFVSITECTIDKPTISELYADGDNIEWFDSEFGGSLLHPTTLLQDGATYWAQQTENGCVSNRNSTSVVLINPSAPLVAEPLQIFCRIDRPTIASLGAQVSHPDNSIVWYHTEFSTIPLDPTDQIVSGESYWAAQVEQSLLCESVSRVEVKVTINTTDNPTTSSNNQSFCEIEAATIANLNITGNNIQWYDTATSTVALPTAQALVHGEDYYATQTNGTTNCESIQRTKVTATINSIAAPTTISNSQTFCDIDAATIADLNITGTNIKWYDTATSTTPLDPSDILLNGEDYYATQTDTANGCESVLRTKITSTISTTTPPSAVSNTQSFCEIDEAKVSNLTITGSNIKWYDTATSTTPLNSTEVLIDGADYYATQTSAANCESSARTKVTVTINKTSAPTTTSNNQSFCEISKASIANIAITGTNIKWYATATSNVELPLTEALVNNEDYYATQTDPNTGCESFLRTKVTITITTTSEPTTSSNNQSFCEIAKATIANLDITGTNIKWYDTATSTTPLNSTDLLVNGEEYFATQTDASNGCESVSRTKVTVTITTTLAPTTVSNNQSFCEINNATIANLNITGNNIKWYATATSTVTLELTEVLVDGEDYFATQTDASNGCESVLRTKITAAITTTTPPTTTSSNQSFCEIDEAKVSDLDITGTNIKWYDTATSTTPLNSTELLINNGDYFASQTDSANGCESLTRTKVTVLINITDAPSTSANNQSFCEINGATIADLDITGTNIKWYDTETSTIALSSSEILVDGEDYYATQSDATTSCESFKRTKISISIVTIVAPTTTTTDQVFCESKKATIADLEVSGSNIKWYDTETSTTALDPTTLLENAGDYYATQSNASSTCESNTRLKVNVTLTQVATPTLNLNGEQFCILKGPFTLLDLADRIVVSSGNTVVWYDSFPNGNTISSSETLVHNTTYFAVLQDLDGCESTTALEITVDLEACNDDDLVIYDGFSPNNDGINDLFNIKNINLLYPNYTIEYYNRWGNIVYKGNANKPSWNGELNGNGELLPKGVYFYVLVFNKNDKKPRQGRLYLSR